METASALAVYTFNDGISSRSEVAKRLGVTPTPFLRAFWQIETNRDLKPARKRPARKPKL